MSVARPPGADWLGWLAGMKWPEGDEDKLWAIAESWATAGAQIRALDGAIDIAKRSAEVAYPFGDGGDQMIAELKKFQSGQGSTEELAKWFEKVGESAESMGTEIEYGKLMFYASLVALAFDLAMAPLSGPFTAAAEAAAIAVARKVVTIVAKKLMTGAARAGARSAGAAAIKFTVRHTIWSTMMAGGQELGVQGIQIAGGHRSGLDVKQLATFTGIGAGMGIVAGPIGMGLTKSFSSGLAKNFGESQLAKSVAFSGAGTLAGGLGGLGMATGTWMTGGEFDPRMISSGALSGGVGGLRGSFLPEHGGTSNAAKDTGGGSSPVEGTTSKSPAAKDVSPEKANPGETGGSPEKSVTTQPNDGAGHNNGRGNEAAPASNGHSNDSASTGNGRGNEGAHNADSHTEHGQGKEGAPAADKSGAKPEHAGVPTEGKESSRAAADSGGHTGNGEHRTEGANPAAGKGDGTSQHATGDEQGGRASAAHDGSSTGDHPGNSGRAGSPDQVLPTSDHGASSLVHSGETTVAGEKPAAHPMAADAQPALARDAAPAHTETAVTGSAAAAERPAVAPVAGDRGGTPTTTGHPETAPTKPAPTTPQHAPARPGMDAPAAGTPRPEVRGGLPVDPAARTAQPASPLHTRTGGPEAAPAAAPHEGSGHPAPRTNSPSTLEEHAAPPSTGERPESRIGARPDDSSGRSGSPHEENGRPHPDDPSGSRRENEVGDRNPNEPLFPEDAPVTSREHQLAMEALEKRDGVDLRPHADSDMQGAREKAAENSAWWHSLTEREQAALVRTFPHQIGNADGIPPHVRDRANRLSMVRDLAEWSGGRYDYSDLSGGNQRNWVTRLRDWFTLPDSHNQLRNLEKTVRALESIERSIAQQYHGDPPESRPPVHVLSYDTMAFNGEGRAVVAIGNVTRASSVSFHVPGITTTMRSLEVNLNNAFNHYVETSKLLGQKETASIAWIGYDAPSGFPKIIAETPHYRFAEEGGQMLARDIAAFNQTRELDALRPGGHPAPDVHVFGHSYGSVTTSYAGAGGRMAGEVASITLLGSPGAGPVGHVSRFGLGDQVFVASSARDPVTWVGSNKSETMASRLLPVLGEGHGIDPAIKAFGAQRITAQFEIGRNPLKAFSGLLTHTNYYNHIDGPGRTMPTESLANFARIAAGLGDHVSIEPHRPGIPEPSVGQRVMGSFPHDPAQWRGHDPANADNRTFEGTSNRYRQPEPASAAPTEHRPNDCGPEALRTIKDLTGNDGVRVPTDPEIPRRGMTAEELEAHAGGDMKRYGSHGAIADQLHRLGDGASMLVVDEYHGVGADGVGAHAYVIRNDGGQLVVHDRTLGGEPHPFPPRTAASEVRAIYGIGFDANGHPLHPNQTNHSGPNQPASRIGNAEPNAGSPRHPENDGSGGHEGSRPPDEAGAQPVPHRGDEPTSSPLENSKIHPDSPYAADFIPPQHDEVIRATAEPGAPFGLREDLLPLKQYEVEGRGTFWTDETGRVTHVEASTPNLRDLHNPDVQIPLPETMYSVHTDHGTLTYKTSSTGEIPRAAIFEPPHTSRGYEVGSPSGDHVPPADGTKLPPAPRPGEGYPYSGLPPESKITVHDTGGNYVGTYYTDHTGRVTHMSVESGKLARTHPELGKNVQKGAQYRVSPDFDINNPKPPTENFSPPHTSGETRLQLEGKSATKAEFPRARTAPETAKAMEKALEDSKFSRRPSTVDPFSKRNLEPNHKYIVETVEFEDRGKPTEKRIVNPYAIFYTDNNGKVVAVDTFKPFNPNLVNPPPKAQIKVENGPTLINTREAVNVPAPTERNPQRTKPYVAPHAISHDPTYNHPDNIHRRDDTGQSQVGDVGRGEFPEQNFPPGYPEELRAYAGGHGVRNAERLGGENAHQVAQLDSQNSGRNLSKEGREQSWFIMEEDRVGRGKSGTPIGPVSLITFNVPGRGTPVVMWQVWTESPHGGTTQTWIRSFLNVPTRPADPGN